MLGGVAAVAIGAYGVLDQGAPSGLGVPMLVAGGALLAGSLALASRGTARTRYRPEPWGRPEWSTVGAGVGTLLGLVLCRRAGIDGLTTSSSPLEWPGFPVLPALAIALAALPALTTPPPASTPAPTTTQRGAA